MVRSRTVRSILRQTKGLRNAFLLFILGLCFFVLGSALSFKVLISPLLSGIESRTHELLVKFVTTDDMDQSTHFLGGACLLLGFVFIARGVSKSVSHVLETLDPNLGTDKLGEQYIRRQKLARGPRVVALGGGTGLSTLLRGLKMHTLNMTAIVTVTDDGGSSGRLRKEMGMIPPGDIRNCLVALADAEKSMTDLFQYRFKGQAGTLSGHSMGNLLIAALVDQAKGDFEQAVQTASSVLSIRGTVIPTTLQSVGLTAILEDGRQVSGETQIVDANSLIRRIFLDDASVVANPAALQAIQEAEIICIGPGSVYTSLIPNLMVPGIVEAIQRSKAIKIYICNVMTQPGESDSFTASEHLTALQLHANTKLVDYVLINTVRPSPQMLERYAESNQFLVEPDFDRIRAMGMKVIPGDYVSETDFVRHDPAKLASKIMSLVERR